MTAKKLTKKQLAEYEKIVLKLREKTLEDKIGRASCRERV